MLVLVTGAAGTLGRTLIPCLVAGGHEVRALDLHPPERGPRVEPITADVRDGVAMQDALESADAVVHAAALHGIHLKTRSEDDFWYTNVTGTFNVYRAATRARVKQVVLASTMGVYGRATAPSEEAWAVVTEATPVAPQDIYGLSKHLCEELARYHARVEALPTVALRLGMFVPETFERYGFRLLFGGVDERDVAHAAMLALSLEARGGFEAFNVMADTPFGPQDAADMHADLRGVLERRWPGISAVIDEKGLDLDALVWRKTLWPVNRAKLMLGYQPRYGFGAFVDALRAGDRS